MPFRDGLHDSLSPLYLMDDDNQTFLMDDDGTTYLVDSESAVVGLVASSVRGSASVVSSMATGGGPRATGR